MKSKTYDYATSCSSGNAIVIEASVYKKMIYALKKKRGYLCNEVEKNQLKESMWDSDGRRKSESIAKPLATIAELATFKHQAKSATFFMVEEVGMGKTPFFK